MMENPYQPFQPTLTQSGLNAFGLSQKSTAACISLRGIVHSYLQIEATMPTLYPIIPDGTQAIFISPNGSLLSGPRLQAYDLQILNAGEYFGIWFYPGGLRHFVNLDVSEIKDKFVDDSCLSWHGFGDLYKRIYQNNNFRDRANVCEQWLLSNLNKLPINQFDHALSLIYQSFGNIRISGLSKLVGWSDRHLNRLFHRNTGLSTKEFALTIRIQHACKQMYSVQASSSNTHHDFGYFDQSHLIKNWNKFLLSSPSTFGERFKSDFYNS
jgi:AraC-like DNA-binding protein